MKTTALKKTLLLLLMTWPVINLFAQTPPVDSLNKLLASAKEDTIKVNLLIKLSFYSPSFQQGLDFADEALALSQEIKYKKGEIDAKNRKGAQLAWISNFPTALRYHLDALKMAETISYHQGIADANYAIGYIYKEQGDTKTALRYLQKAEAVFYSSGNNYRLATVNVDLGDTYFYLDKQDSALKYYQRSYEYYNSTADKFQFNLALNGLGNLQLKMGNQELALAYYRQAIQNGILYADTFGLANTFLNVARLYDARHQHDSSVMYAKKSMLFAQRINLLKTVIASGKALSKLYENKNDKEALRYLQISQVADDSLFSTQRTIEIQNMTLDETQRQSELEQTEKKEAEERIQHIQFALIALGIVTFLILFLLLSHSIIVTEKSISFFGILGLLIVFEFINLLIHPFLERVTHHSPVLMLLGLVAIASMLIPLHHHSEKWIKEKMTEKNKKIRLENAKRTIQQLDKQHENL